MVDISTRKISRRAAVVGGLALPGLVAAGACAAAEPMHDAELRALLRLYNDARKQTQLQTDPATIARLCDERDFAAGKIMRPHDFVFEGWLATAKEAKWTDTGNYLGYRVELVPNICLQTRIRSDDGGGDGTMIRKDDPLADVVVASRDRVVRVSGVMQVRDYNHGHGPYAPIDLLAKSSRGQQTSLLVWFKRVEKAI